MDSSDVVIVGGGPAGSSCAWRLRAHGIPCIVLEAQNFPRTKLCAGWITPAVMRRLGFDLSSYPHGIIRLDRIRVEYFGRKRSRVWNLPTRQYSIRRYEFDHWLLERSGAVVRTHKVRQIQRDGDDFVIDGAFRCRCLVGAGGTLCPVYSTYFKVRNPRSQDRQVGTLEEEFPLAGRDDSCRMWFVENGLPGYSWYVPKGNGWVNVGIGALSERLKNSGMSLRNHWDHFAHKLVALGLVDGHEFRPGGCTYYMRSPSQNVQRGNCYIVGDAAGLATRDLAEGIGPAVESGILAADAIATRTPYSLGRITTRSWPSFAAGLFRSLF